ncbi:hypothetical protein IV498_05760 [Paenarthrobacter sp. Z7-10]|uniref:hypothetical protein n=1 Tax=Paenarthrobacter sp. Z7-10 TaxID=2787635 RepID=UPI0022A905B3|nr:hypothetical protein [Paenarthrobacter sp. Z7-10]MCZ2402702.1 hypothetical protein [Paenarthrobacter sp. Z7-10]
MSTNRPAVWPTETDIDRMRAATLDRVSQHQQRIRRHRIAGTTAVAVMVIGSASAAIYIPTTQRPADSSTYCYSEQSLDSASIQATNPDGSANQDRTGRKAMTWCGLNWATGELPAVKGSHSAASQHSELSVPPLGVCVRPDNVLGVFPLTTTSGQLLTNAQLCRDLNLRRANSNETGDGVPRKDGK